MMSNGNGNNNNTSWRSSMASSSFDQQDGGEEDNHNNTTTDTNTSFNSNADLSRNSNNSRGASRYNHYRRDPPTRVKPWMRDLSVTGNSAGAGAPSAARSSSRFGRSSSNNNYSSAERSHSGSCNNSVSSQSSYRSKDSSSNQHAVSFSAGVPREVTQTTQLSQHRHNISSVSHDEEDDEHEEMSVQEAKTPRVANISEGGAATGDAMSSTFNATEIEEEEDKEQLPQEEEEKAEATNDEHDTTRKETNEGEEHSDIKASPTDEVEETNNRINATAEKKEVPDTVDENHADDETASWEPLQVEGQKDVWNKPPQEEQDANKTHLDKDTADETETSTMPESDSTGSDRSSRKSSSHEQQQQQHEYSYYDELPQVQPSTYNPMAAVSIMNKKEEEPVDSASAATAPLVASHGELLNDDNILMEESSDEEEEEVEEKLQQQQDDEEFYKLWPRCISKHDVPTNMEWPMNWQQLQIRAVQATKAWIRKEQDADSDNDSSSNTPTSEEDKKEEEEEESPYCQFAASLKDCPALTTGFYSISQNVPTKAEQQQNDNNNHAICFCPCSAHMEEWQHHALEGAVQDNLLKKCSKQQYTPKSLLQHCEEVAGSDFGDHTDGGGESRILHAIIHKYLESLFGGDNDQLAHLFEATLVGGDDDEEEAVAAQEDLEIMNEIRQDIQRLEQVNAELTEKLKVAEEKVQVQEAKEIESATLTREQTEKLSQISENLIQLQESNAQLTEKLKEATDREQTVSSKNIEASSTLKEQEEKLSQVSEELKRLEQSNADLVKKAKMAEERAKIEEARNADAVASSQAQAEMMGSLCDELKILEEKNTALNDKLKLAAEKEKELEAKTADVASEKEGVSEQVIKLTEEMSRLEKTNAELSRKLKLAESSVEAHASQQPRTLVHVGEMPVDVGRFRVQFQKYFNHLRLAQLKSHCIRDKSPVKMVLQYSPQAKQSINIQALLDECAEREAQDTTYMFRSLDVFNKGHFHSHRLLIPWKINSKDGGDIPRAEFFSQLWSQIGSLKVKIGDDKKKTEVPLFQEAKGILIPMPNAMLEGMLRVTPVELDRIFAAKIAPYYRAIGRMMIQCIGATADDISNNNNQYSIPMAWHTMPLILRNKLLRGVDPMDECYPLEELIDHAFTLLGMENMSQDKAFEYFGIDSRDYHDANDAVRQIRVEIHEMWIKERSLALKALEEGLSLNGLLDLSFCCGLVPLEAINEVLFSL